MHCEFKKIILNSLLAEKSYSMAYTPIYLTK